MAQIFSFPRLTGLGRPNILCCCLPNPKKFRGVLDEKFSISWGTGTRRKACIQYCRYPSSWYLILEIRESRGCQICTPAVSAAAAAAGTCLYSEYQYLSGWDLPCRKDSRKSPKICCQHVSMLEKYVYPRCLDEFRLAWSKLKLSNYAPSQ